jgi:hypothetical protein
MMVWFVVAALFVLLAGLAIVVHDFSEKRPGKDES